MIVKYFTDINDNIEGFEYKKSLERRDLRRGVVCFYTKDKCNFCENIIDCANNVSGLVITVGEKVSFEQIGLNLYHLEIRQEYEKDLLNFASPYMQMIAKIKNKDNSLSAIALEIQREKRGSDILAEHYKSLQKGFRSSLKVYADWTLTALLKLLEFAKKKAPEAELHEMGDLFTEFLTSDVFRHQGAGILRKTEDGWMIASQRGNWGRLEDVPKRLKYRTKPWYKKNQIFMPFILDIADFVIVIKNHELLEYSEQELGVYDLIVNYAKHLYENKRFADDMLHAQKELEHKKHTEVIGNLVAGVAHEINTPVQYISDNVNFVTETFSQMKPAYYKTSYIDVENDDVIKKVKEIQEYFKEIDSDYTMEEIYDALCQSRDGIEQISQIVSALKIFMHPGSKEKERININDIIENALIISRSEWKRVAKIKKDLDKDLPLIDAHKNELSQALLNLIVNAAHAVEKRHKQSLKGQIEITTKVVNFRVEIIIKDNGIGMDKETKARMYEPFFTTKQTGKGTGQGLYLAYDTVVSKHGGKIRCQSTQGKGTTFKLILNTPTTS